LELTDRARYAVTAMLDVARHAEPITLAELARRQSLSHAYLGKLLLRLYAGGLLMRSVGSEHIFWLARAPADIALADIVSAVHDDPGGRRRRGAVRARRPDHRLAHYLWETLNQRILEFLAGISLADLLAQRPGRKPRLRAVPRPASD
jgi:Rrf2 family iron-sulfur cluster assembly transcriptional regulator